VFVSRSYRYAVICRRILFYAYVLADMTTLGYANDAGYLIVTNNTEH
jgi:hypothetical protein